MAGTTNVDRETEYEVNIMGWDTDGKELTSNEKVTIQNNKEREEKEGFITVKAYNGGYKGKEADKGIDK